MTWEERVDAVAAHGFTERQAGFLVTVMLHCGRLSRPAVLRVRRHRLRPEDARLLSVACWRAATRRRDGCGITTARGCTTSTTSRSTRHRRAGQPPPAADDAGRAPSNG